MTSYSIPGAPVRVGTGMYDVPMELYAINDVTEGKVYEYIPALSLDGYLAVINDDNKLEQYPNNCFEIIPNSLDFILD